MGVPLPALNSGNTLYITVYINFYRKSSPQIPLEITSLTEPYRASERVIWCGLVVTGAYARVGGDYSVACTGNTSTQRDRGGMECCCSCRPEQIGISGAILSLVFLE